MTALMAEMDLEAADLSGADLKGANLSETDLEAALSLKDTDLRGVKGLTKEQLEACQAKGALIDEDFTTSSSQSTISPPPPSLSNSVQFQPAIPTHENRPSSDTGESNDPSSSKPNPES